MKRFMQVLFAITLIAPLTGCVLSDEETIELSEDGAELARCCSIGTFSCPASPDVYFTYGPIGCRNGTWPVAKSLCEDDCDTACVDSGLMPDPGCQSQ